MDFLNALSTTTPPPVLLANTLSSVVRPSILIWGAFIVVAFIFVVTSIILLYHWQKYKITRGVPQAMMITYVVVAMVPLIVMLLSGLAYLASINQPTTT